MRLGDRTLKRFESIFRLPVGAVFLLLLMATSGHANSGSGYSDMWAVQNEDGSVTVWGIGVSDDTAMHGYEHYVQVATTITGPNGNYGDQVASYGYSDSLVELPGVEGEYEISSTHWMPPACGGSFSSAAIIGWIAITIRSLERTHFLSSSLAHYRPCNPGGICRGEINISTSQTGGTLPLYVYVDYLSWKTLLGPRLCFVADVDPTAATVCPPDPLP